MLDQIEIAIFLQWLTLSRRKTLNFYCEVFSVFALLIYFMTSSYEIG